MVSSVLVGSFPYGNYTALSGRLIVVPLHLFTDENEYLLTMPLPKNVITLIVKMETVFLQVLNNIDDDTNNALVSTLTKIVKDIKIKHKYVFQGIQTKLGSDSITKDQFKSIALETIKDGVNWGRIASLLAMATFVSADDRNDVATTLNDITQEWVSVNGGPSAANEYFTRNTTSWLSNCIPSSSTTALFGLGIIGAIAWFLK